MMLLLRNKSVWLVFVLFMLCFSGCNRTELKVLLVMPASSDVSFESVSNAAQAWAKDKNATLRVVAPLYASATAQQEVLEQELSQYWDVICISPSGVAQISPLLEYARDCGATIVSAGGGRIIESDYYIEPFSPEEIGSQMMDSLAEHMGADGMFITTMPDDENDMLAQTELAAVQRQKLNYAGMFAALRREPTENSPHLASQSVDRAYESYQISGALFFSTGEGAGIARWNNQNQNVVAAVGIGEPALLREELAQYGIQTLFYWSKENLICACLDLGWSVVKGKKPGEILSLPYEGYETMRSDGQGGWIARDIRQSSSIENGR